MENRAQLYAAEAGRMLQLPTIYVKEQPLCPAFGELYNLFEELFPNLYRECEVMDFEGSKVYLLKGTDPEGGLPLAVMSHHDVVEASGEWEQPPFSGTVVDGKLWGRGALDIKVNLYAMMRAFDEYIAEGKRPKRDTYLITSCMEEVGGNDLVADWFEAQGIEIGALVDEGSPIMADPFPGIHGDWAAVSLAEKGTANFKFTARGAGGHPMMLHRNSPLVRLGKFMADCEDNPPFPFEPNAPIAGMLERIDALLPEGQKFDGVFDDEKLEAVLGPIEAGMIRTTMVFTCAKGSDEFPKVPTEAYVVANLRLAPPITPDKALEILAERAAKYDIEASIETRRDPSCIADVASKGFEKVEEAMRSVNPQAVVLPYVLSGGTDTKHFHKVCKCCLRFTPLRVDRAQQFAVHGLNENIDVDAIPGAVDFFKTLMTVWE